jgi:hypothetical protein
LSIGTAALASLMVTPAIAGQHGNSGNGPSTHTPPTHPSTPDNAGSKTTGSTNGNSGGSHGSHGSHGPADPDSSANNTGPNKGGPTHTSTSTTTASVNFATAPLGQKLTKNTALQSKLTTRLTALGYKGTVFEAAYGFKNLGQFVAATNVSRNLGIPFDQLKLQMTGLSVDANGKVMKANLNADGTITLVDPANVTNAAPTRSLGQSIQTLKPNANGTAAANTASEEAETEIEHTSKNSKSKS